MLAGFDEHHAMSHQGVPRTLYTRVQPYGVINVPLCWANSLELLQAILLYYFEQKIVMRANKSLSRSALPTRSLSLRCARRQRKQEPKNWHWTHDRAVFD